MNIRAYMFNNTKGDINAKEKNFYVYYSYFISNWNMYIIYIYI